MRAAPSFREEVVIQRRVLADHPEPALCAFRVAVDVIDAHDLRRAKMLRVHDIGRGDEAVLLMLQVCGASRGGDLLFALGGALEQFEDHMQAELGRVRWWRTRLSVRSLRRGIRD